MILDALRLTDFRAHKTSSVAFAPKVNLVVGPNGAGKTNLLEAIHYLCLTKSFLASQDGYVLRKGASFFEVEGHFRGHQRPAVRVRLAYQPNEGKRIFVNGAPLERLADIVGELPVVLFAPGDHALTDGGPEERRKFLNNILSQAKPVYLNDLLHYRRALKQRNELLQQYRRTRQGLPEGVLASWDAELVKLGSRVIARRWRFIQTFVQFLEAAYHRMESVAEHPTLTYQTFTALRPEDDEQTISEAYLRKLKQVARREREMGRTLIGPHRDELVFRLNDFEVRRYASQGQHRTFGLALKLAQYFYLHDRLDEPPLLLLDDIFDNLDLRRTQVFLELLASDDVGQSIITAAQQGPFVDAISFEVAQNQLTRVTPPGIVEAASQG